MKRSGGFTLLEIIVVIGLVAVVGLVSTQVFVATLRVWKTSAREQATQSRFDLAVGQLRRDVWSASAIESPNPASLEIQNPAGLIHWTADPQHGLRRSSDRPEDLRQWPELGRMKFKAEGPMLNIRLEPTHEEAGGQMVLVSQSMMLAGRPQ